MNKAFESLVQKIIEKEREYSSSISSEKNSSKVDEYRGAIIALRNILVDASEIRYLSCRTEKE